MKTARFFLLLTFLLGSLFLQAQTSAAWPMPVYNGNDLGIQYEEDGYVLKIWSPQATAARVYLYEHGSSGKDLGHYDMVQGSEGSWSILLPEAFHGLFYTCQVLIDGIWSDQTPDPYVKLVGVNGQRGWIGLPEEADPDGWDHDRRPTYGHKTDAIVYELNLRDATIDTCSGATYKGFFLGLAERGTRNPAGLSTGLDHIRSLGVTHIQLMPVFDFASLDESQRPQIRYNWGYEPKHFNALEGSFATDPYDPLARVYEFKTMVAAIHKAGMRVIMDVVYNHTMDAAKTSFEQLVPGYYYRAQEDGRFSNASACGNEMASERPMMRKFMIESLLYWIREYHIDGFRFDLMGIHDIETMNLISKALHEALPDVLLYGEGWTAGASPLPDSVRALKKEAMQLHKVGVFSDDLRDALKGSVFDMNDRGFVSGKPGMEASIQFGVVASIQHPQVHYEKVNYSNAPYAKEPYQTLQYVDCHDNHVLWDKLRLSNPLMDRAALQQMHLLALSIVLTSQGIPFLHAGTEFLRSKQGVENSYESPDSINAIHWADKTAHMSMCKEVQAWIALRKAHPAFRLPTAAAIRNQLSFLPIERAGLVGYTIDGASCGDAWSTIKVYYNATPDVLRVSLPTGNWKRAAVVEGPFAGDPLSGSSVELPARSCTLIFEEKGN